MTGSEEIIGKPVNSDEKNKKTTYVTLEGLEKAKQDVEKISAEAIEELNKLPGNNDFLEQLIHLLKMCIRDRRMGKVELTILRLALFEMAYDDTIPEKVSINEAVELAKKFGGNDSPAFVNGILARFIGKESKEQA